MDRRALPEWYHKGRAIQQAAAAFRSALDERDLDAITFVPIPPSKAKDHPLYDDRVIQMLHAIREAPPLDGRELVVQTCSMSSAHESEKTGERRPSPQELEAVYTIDQRLLAPHRGEIAIVDDVLTTGSHFLAVKAHLQRAFPSTKIVGMFIARRVPETTDLEAP